MVNREPLVILEFLVTVDNDEIQNLSMAKFEAKFEAESDYDERLLDS